MCPVSDTDEVKTPRESTPLEKLVFTPAYLELMANLRAQYIAEVGEVEYRLQTEAIKVRLAERIKSIPTANGQIAVSTALLELNGHLSMTLTFTDLLLSAHGLQVTAVEPKQSLITDLTGKRT